MAKTAKTSVDPAKTAGDKPPARISIRRATSQTDRRSAQRLRYLAYIDERNDTSLPVEVDDGLIVDEADGRVEILLAEIDGVAVGTLTLAFGCDGTLGPGHEVEFGGQLTLPWVMRRWPRGGRV